MTSEQTTDRQMTSHVVVGQAEPGPARRAGTARGPAGWVYVVFLGELGREGTYDFLS